MYLARNDRGGKVRYALHESYQQDGRWLSRKLFDLGTQPERFICYPGGKAFYIDEEIEEQLAAKGRETSQDELEDLFWEFLSPDIRHALNTFRDRAKAQEHLPPLSEREEARIWRQTHVFDKRRLFYLRSGATDQRRLHQITGRYFRLLDCKSRDEIEQLFLRQERILRPHQIKMYVYVIFDLARRFESELSRRMPYGLSQADLDERFLEELCRLNQSDRFWAGQPHDGYLHHYLVRYLIMFFDYDFEPNRLAQDFIREFINRHRRHRPHHRPKAVDTATAAKLFGVSAKELQEMNRQQLTRLYRNLARKYHPDVGGQHDLFIKLTETYQQLVRRKPDK